MGVNHILVVLGAVVLPLNGLLDYLLMKKWGCFGISLSTSIIYFLTAAVKYWFLRRHTGQILNRSTWEVIVGAVLASAAAGSCLWVIRLAIPNPWLGMALGVLGFAVVLASGYAALGLLVRTSSGVIFLPSKRFSCIPHPAVDPESASV
jgi:peptidoglycan biosynthesis protein MviN/MurJ (putative lipid II flippase)